MFGLLILNVAFYVYYSVFIEKAFRDRPLLGPASGAISAVISFITIMILTPMCRWVAKKLTDMENHKTEVEYQSNFKKTYIGI
jgi:hypothetical protein